MGGAAVVELERRVAGEGEPLVFLHGFPLNSAMWGPQLAAMPQGWRGIAPDLRGFGASPDLPGTATAMEDFAHDVVALLDRMDIGKAVICGLSMGGYIAFQLWRLYPERIRALILCDTRAGPDSSDAARARERLARRVEKNGVDIVVETMLPRLISPTTRYTQPGVVASVKAMMTETAPDTVARALRGMAARPSSESILRTIAVPVLVVVGAEDAITSRGQVEFLARSIPGASLETIDEAGHLPPLERPKTFNRILRDFLSRLPAPRPA